MSVKERTITVRVVKRIQEEDFEPYEIQLEESVLMTEPFENPKKMRKKMYGRLKKELDALIDKRWDEISDSREDD